MDESWTVKKAECRRIDAFELWCWRRLLRVPWIARRSTQSILKEISPGMSLEGMTLKLKLQYFEPPHAKSWLIGKDSDAGRDWGQDKGTTEDEMAGWHHWLNGSESEWTPGVGDGQGGLACCGSWGRKESDMTERLNWTELNLWNLEFYCSINVPQVCFMQVEAVDFLGKKLVMILVEPPSRNHCRNWNSWQFISPCVPKIHAPSHIL